MDIRLSNDKYQISLDDKLIGRKVVNITLTNIKPNEMIMSLWLDDGTAIVVKQTDGQVEIYHGNKGAV